VVTLSSSDGAAPASEHAQLVIRPEIQNVGLFEFHMLDVLRAAGRRAARQVLNDAAAERPAMTT
jgi:predicted acylesterase/phospholipase RssA